MHIGMTYEQYWDEPPCLVIFYRKAHKLKVEEENQRLWMQGLYNFAAVSTALSNFHLDGKHHKQNEYMKEPIRIFPMTEAEKEERARREREKITAQFKAMIAAQEERKKWQTQT